MLTSSGSYSIASKSTGSARMSAVLRRIPLIMVTVIFTLISFRYLTHSVVAAEAEGIRFTSSGGITVARIAFGAFPLAFAILAFVSLVSARWRIAGLYMVLTVDGVVIGVRAFSIVAVHSAASARLFAPETALLILSLIAIRLESVALQKSAAGSRHESLVRFARKRQDTEIETVRVRLNEM